MITFFKIFFCLTLACFTGLMYYHSLQRFFRIILLQLIIAIIAQALGVVYDKHHLQENQLIYNAYILLEVWILTAANATYLNSKKEKIIMLCGLVAFGVAMGYDVYQRSVFVFSNHAFLTECILMVIQYLMLLNKQVIRQEQPVNTNPLFWISTGSILYFACNIPYFSMRPYFQKNHSALINSLFILNLILLNFRYFFIAISFFLQKHQPARQHHAR